MMSNSNPFMEVPNQSGAMNVRPEHKGGEGIAIDDLALGEVIEAETWHNTYRIENRGDGKILISGHPQYCPEPVLVELHGSTVGQGILKFHFIGTGMHLEFRHPTLGIIRTSRIKEVRQEVKAS